MVGEHLTTRRKFLAQTATILAGVFLLSGRTVSSLRSRRLVCRNCKALIKDEVVSEIVCCPNCGHEWLTGGLALSDTPRPKFASYQAPAPSVGWNYDQVPFPNFRMLEQTDKPVLSLKQLKFSGRGTA
jgi:hypothetical protein